MNLYDGDLITNLYEVCLSSEDAPFVALGEELSKGVGVAAVSIWGEHLQVQDALSRIVYYQSIESKELAIEDQKIARRVHELQKPLTGAVTMSTRRPSYYWSTPLAGKKNMYYLVLWCVRKFADEQLEAFTNLAPHLSRLVDIVLSSDLFSVQRVTKELEATQFLQKQLMPCIDGLEVSSFLAYRTLPAHELGGDYLDVLRYPDGTFGLTVADAMGKGMPAAFVVLMARTIFRLITKITITPSEVLAELNNHFITEIADVETFVTQFYCTFDPTRGRIVYSNAGHNPPVLFRKDTGKTTFLPGRGVVLGGKPNSSYSLFTVDLVAGDILVIYSDGLKEARDANNTQFGLDGISRTLLKYKEYSADGICDGLIRNVMLHSKEQTDDISFIVIKM